MYHYPYGNSEQLNLDWLLRSWREFQKAIEDMIAPQYDPKIAYPDPALVIYNHVLYTNTVAITEPEEWNPDHWAQTSIFGILS